MLFVLNKQCFSYKKTHNISFINNSYNAIYCKFEQLLQAFHEIMNLLITFTLYVVKLPIYY